MKTTKKPTILVLHGWGASSASFREVKLLLEKEGFMVDVPDLPGFGDRPLVKNPMTFDDYLSFVEKEVGDQKVILIGHSFGGRLAIAFSVTNTSKVSKLILTGASGIPHKLSAKKRAAFILAKTFRFAQPLRKYLYYAIGESDYFRAGILKDTFKNNYKVSIVNYLEKINVPTLLVWGEKDTVVPLHDGEYMQAHIKNAKLLVVKGATHKLPYQMPHVFIEQILPFLKK